MKNKLKKWWPFQLAALTAAIVLPLWVYYGGANVAVSEAVLWIVIGSLTFIALAPLKWG